jgi:phosphoserine phosphatase RsbU/P
LEEKGTILIVDDEVRITDILNLYLKKEGYQTLTAGDGLEALSVMQENVPDLIISDLMMPNMDGIEFCKEVKTRSEFTNPYFIMLTAKATVDSKVEGLKIGADDYITKPFNVKELVARVNSAMRIKALQNEVVEKNVELERYKAAMENELQLAARFQESLIPPDGNISPGIRLTSIYQPTIHIGGDIFDVRNAGDGQIVFFVADVTGHGIVAAVISAMIKLSFIQAAADTSSPSAIAEKINRDIVSTTSEEHFASVFLGSLTPDGSALSFVRAGHPAPYLCQHDGQILPLAPKGFLLGIDPTAQFPQQTVSLSPRDRIFMFTDGISEAEGREGELFGTGRIRQYLARPGASLSGLLDLANQWSGGQYQDDFTLVQLEILERG